MYKTAMAFITAKGVVSCYFKVNKVRCAHNQGDVVILPQFGDFFATKMIGKLQKSVKISQSLIKHVMTDTFYEPPCICIRSVFYFERLEQWFLT